MLFTLVFAVFTPKINPSFLAPSADFVPVNLSVILS